MKVFYHIDNDGKCAAFWVRALANKKDDYPLEFYRINYDAEFPLNIIQPNEQVYIVDYSIMPEQMDKLLARYKLPKLSQEEIGNLCIFLSAMIWRFGIRP